MLLDRFHRSFIEADVSTLVSRPVVAFVLHSDRRQQLVQSSWTNSTRLKAPLVPLNCCGALSWLFNASNCALSCSSSVWIAIPDFRWTSCAMITSRILWESSSSLRFRSWIFDCVFARRSCNFFNKIKEENLSRTKSTMPPNGDVFEKSTIFEIHEVVCRRFETHLKFYLSFTDFSIEHVASIFVSLRHFFLQFQSSVECLKS